MAPCTRTPSSQQVPVLLCALRLLRWRKGCITRLPAMVSGWNRLCCWCAWADCLPAKHVACMQRARGSACSAPRLPPRCRHGCLAQQMLLSLLPPFQMRHSPVTHFSRRRQQAAGVAARPHAGHSADQGGAAGVAEHRGQGRHRVSCKSVTICCRWLAGFAGRLSICSRVGRLG